ncbi:M14 family zinc carboxypeptidase [Phaeocystidibacter luteus]|uniref:Peptidase M14 domain-containing protein n=1 Tax=Phaeocystidibacter luteus TaxID=911197 RepID=A0A6N6RLH3_9FLAO|nr:M14 family zinc carboxypeptidase [Phaeocystidibacter luteus]KAB2814423.1 hypothetical protein F8C67_01430 [Phaeocystidibacter luteus]
MTKFKVFVSSALVLMSICAESQILNIPQKHLENETFTYEELIGHYQNLADSSERCVLIELGISDAGFPIHALIATNAAVSEENIDQLRATRWVLAINNGIHPGESCGVDASLHFINDYLSKPFDDLSNEMIVIVPMYNIGGSLNRRPHTRANQDGPNSQGFRGNARNYDLNRDLLKADTRNTLALYELFKRFDPEVFVDTHSTNGADYPYEMTLIASPWQKYPKPMQSVVQRFEDSLYTNVTDRGTLISPYINVFGRTPNEGFPMFVEGAMYTTGYAALHGSVAFVTEAHMLKPYDVRVRTTRDFLEATLELGGQFQFEIADTRAQARAEWKDRQVIDWEIDEEQADTLDFMVFEAGFEVSDVTGFDRLKYENEIEEVRVPYFNRLKPALTIVVPEYYYIPVGQWEMLERFAAVGIEMEEFTSVADPNLPVKQFHVDSYTLAERPYEGHVRLENLDVSLTRRVLPAGKYMRISTKQEQGRYLQEVLHPLAPSSFAHWNMFSAYLQQKEHYSEYVFEDTAKKLLEENEDLKEAFEEKLESDQAFANNPHAQLYFIYTNSEYYEPEHMHLPYYLSWD